MEASSLATLGKIWCNPWGSATRTKLKDCLTLAGDAGYRVTCGLPARPTLIHLHNNLPPLPHNLFSSLKESRGREEEIDEGSETKGNGQQRR